MRLAAVQLDLVRGDVAANLARAEAGLREAAGGGAGLAVLPELWPTSFVERPGEAEVAASAEALARVAALSEELGLVVAGSALAAGAPGERPRNRLVVHDRGREVLRYDKVHLFSPTGEREAFSAGDAVPPVAETAVGRVGGLVCYDLRFGPLCWSLLDEAPDVVVVPAQWPEPRASHWRALAVGRAVELQAFVVATNRAGTEPLGRRQVLAFPGNSLVVDPAGRVLAEGRGGAGIVAAEVDPDLVRRVRREVPVRRDARRAPPALGGPRSGSQGLPR